MDKELALRTFGYLIEHYKTHNETTINKQEIEAIEFILKDNGFLEQQVKKQKEVISRLKEYINPLITNKDDEECYPINFYVKDVLLSILKEVSE